jgi:hypothetical protein
VDAVEDILINFLSLKQAPKGSAKLVDGNDLKRGLSRIHATVVTDQPESILNR